MFRQTLVHEGPYEDDGQVGRVLVTYLPRAGVPRPVRVAGTVVLESDSPAVWFTFPGAHHDIGRFHTPGGDLTGYYANMLTPVEILPRRGVGTDAVDEWRTTDLFADLFVTPGGDVHELDLDELEEAVERGWIEPATAAGARRELDRLARRARAGAWPPSVVEEWTLDRARRAAGDGCGHD